MAILSTVSGDPVLIDDEDAPRAHGLRIYALRSGHTCYAIYMDYSTGKQKTMYLHRLIRDDVPEGTRIDHINGDGMDNRRANLRPATASQNGANQHRRRGGSSEWAGVCWNKRRNKWAAYITVDQKRHHIGVFADEEAAARAYDAAAVREFGEFARVNFPDILIDPSPPPAALVRTSQYRGVSREKRGVRWEARLTVKGKTHHLGAYATEEDAARAYDTAAGAALGSKARLNFPPTQEDPTDAPT